MARCSDCEFCEIRWDRNRKRLQARCRNTVRNGRWLPWRWDADTNPFAAMKKPIIWNNNIFFTRAKYFKEWIHFCTQPKWCKVDWENVRFPYKRYQTLLPENLFPGYKFDEDRIPEEGCSIHGEPGVYTEVLNETNI